MLTIYRRHRAKCKFTSRRAKCSCPIWVQGTLRDETIRRSLNLTNWEAAQRTIREWEVHGRKNVMSISDAYDRFIAQHEAHKSADKTIKKHKRLKKLAVDFFGDRGVRSLTPDDVSKFRESWGFAPLTTRNTIERLRAFFKFCIDREWVERNPASTLKLPTVDEVDVKPFTPVELALIRTAVETFPNWGIYKTNTRDRVRAFVLALRWTGMRIGDVVQLSKDKVVDGQVTLRTDKNGKRVCIPIHPEMDKALKKIENGEDYFWSGNGKVSSGISDWHRTLARLGRDLDFNFHSHRFRHTLAAELLSAGVPVVQVSTILGNSPRIVEKHYSQFIEQTQKAIDDAVKLVWK